jgi:hypothetical protein
VIKEKFVLDGYSFDNKKMYEIAAKEKKIIDYIKGHTDFNNKASVKKVYMQLIERESFATPVGFAFLEELKGIINNGADDGSRENKNGVMQEVSLPAIPVRMPKTTTVVVDGEDTDKAKFMELADYYHDKLIIVIIVSVVLAAMVIAMLCITIFDKASPFANAEETLQDKYSAWSDELSLREEAVRQAESELADQGVSIENKDNTATYDNAVIGDDSALQQ